MILDPNSNYFPQGFQISHSNSILTQQQHQDPQQVLVPSNSIQVPVPSMANNSGASLLSGLSLLKDRVHQVQLLALTAPDLEPSATSLAAATMGSLIQEIIGTATSMMFYCQQLNHLNQASSGTAVPSPTAVNNNHDNSINSNGLNNWDGQQGLCHDTVDNLNVTNFNMEATAGKAISVPKLSNSERVSKSRPSKGSLRLGHATATSNKIDVKNTDDFEIIELKVADLLAKYTHYCQICGKGFKRDANLRMHMRAHGDEYKSSAALSKPSKVDDGNAMFGTTSGSVERKKYSCPQEGCRWNKNHPKFHPLKSMICIKNHYKRSHCPKLYVCKKCNGKWFSVLSDLRTHEKHCGDAKWRCTCGATFSRKDKLTGHVILFRGHAPVVYDEGIRISVPAMRIWEAYDRGRISEGCLPYQIPNLGHRRFWSGLNVYPEGMEKRVDYVCDGYNHTPMFVTETGTRISKPQEQFDDFSLLVTGINSQVVADWEVPSSKTAIRANFGGVIYMDSYLNSLVSTIRKGAVVGVYFAWFQMDN